MKSKGSTYFHPYPFTYFFTSHYSLTLNLLLFLFLSLTFFMSSPTQAAPSSSAETCSRLLSDSASLLDKMNKDYTQLHFARENAYWKESMGHADADQEALRIADEKLNQYLQDPINLNRAQQANELLNEAMVKGDGIPMQDYSRLSLGLEGFIRMFESNALPQDPRANAEFAEMQRLESELRNFRKKIPIGYINPKSPQDRLLFVASTPQEMRLIVANNPDESMRMSAFAGLRKFEKTLLQSPHFLQLIAQRNRFARSIGFENFYKMKVMRQERMEAAEIFQTFDEVIRKTQQAYDQLQQNVAIEKGRSAILPWNYEYRTGGHLAQQVEPYFPLELALSRSLETFAALGIDFQNALIQIDLIDRPQGPGRNGKRNNGFMQGPRPALWDIHGQWYPAEINITANAIPGRLGSGLDSYSTLLHELGHAAHFSNQKMYAVAFTQEYAPSSLAFMETQSMFMDALLNDPHWLGDYAATRDGQPMPPDLIKAFVLQQERYFSRELRSLMVIPYFEWSLYNLPDSDLTPERVLQLARQVENKLLGSDSPRPTLTVDHLLNNDSSAYYHAYSLARMAVIQTQQYFKNNFGRIVDNPHIGEALRERYWRNGNLYTFSEFIEQMTGEKFSSQATIDQINGFSEEKREKEIEQILQDEKSSKMRPTQTNRIHARSSQNQKSNQQQIESHDLQSESTMQILRKLRSFLNAFALKSTATSYPRHGLLNIRLRMVHGDQVISTNEDGKSIKEMSEDYARWIEGLVPKE